VHQGIVSFGLFKKEIAVFEGESEGLLRAGRFMCKIDVVADIC